MIFDTNILKAEHRADQWLRRGLLAALVIAVGAGLALVLGIADLQADGAALDRALGKLGKQSELARKEYDERMGRLPEGIGRSLEALSSLPTYNGRPPAALLYQLEKRLPREMHLTQLRQDRTEGSVMLEARTRNGAAVTELLKNLENVEGFTEVRMLGRESADEGAVVVRVSFREGKDGAGDQ